jgi:hypothetical protein
MVTLWTVSSAATDIVISAVIQLSHSLPPIHEDLALLSIVVVMKQVFVYSLRRVKSEFHSTDG